MTETEWNVAHFFSISVIGHLQQCFLAHGSVFGEPDLLKLA